jgi:ABC-type phosphate/phosphonate transport system substrate-binding protein
MAKVARALHHAHQHGVLHRDIKPGNILLDGGGEPHLTDFGLAKLLGPGATRRTAAGSILGTPCYMAPEQASGETHLVSTAADVYSLGAVLYEMLTGHPPFRGRTPVETIHRLLNEEPKHPTTLNGSVDPDLATICLKCLERAPPRRYSSALALAEDLERWLRREPIEARPVRFLGRVWRWGRREPVLAGMTAGVVALLAALAVLGLTLWQSAKREANDEVTKAEGVMRLLNAEIETKWTNQDSVLILAETLALEANRRLPVGILSVRVVLGVHAHSRRANAVNLFRSCVPLVSALQTNQPMLSNQQVLFDLQMYVSHTNAMEGLLRNEVDLMRLNPATYVLLRQREPSLVPIAQEFCDGQAQLRGAIFTRTDNTNIHRLEDLKGQPFAVDSPASGLGPDVVKAALVKWGFHAGDFGPLIEFPSSDTAIAAVRKGECGAGATELNKVLRYLSITNGLRILTNLQCPSYLWVATKKLDPAILPVVRACLVSLRDPKVLATVGLNVTEIREARAADFDAFEQEIEKAREFDLPRRQGAK